MPVGLDFVEVTVRIRRRCPAQLCITQINRDDAAILVAHFPAEIHCNHQLLSIKTRRKRTQKPTSKAHRKQE
jgi:hypothetical protein